MTFVKYQKPDQGSKTKKIGNMFLENYKFATLEDTREIYYYDESKGVYIPAKVMIEETARTQADEDVSKHEMNEIFYYIETNKTIVKRSEFDADPYVVNVKNGLLDLRTGKLGPHRSDYLSLVQIPVEYDPKAACPNIAKFLTNVQDKEGIFKIVKLLGYILMKSAKYQKAFLFVGSGANGKGTLINLIEKFVGEDNTSSQPMQALSKRFAAAELFGKMVNAYADFQKKQLMIQECSRCYCG
jgi:putative DNA primase/helicase